MAHAPPENPLPDPVCGFRSEVEGVSLYLSDFTKPITDRMSKDFFSDPSNADLECVRTGPVKVGGRRTAPRDEPRDRRSARARESAVGREPKSAVARSLEAEGLAIAHKRVVERRQTRKRARRRETPRRGTRVGVVS